MALSAALPPSSPISKTAVSLPTFIALIKKTSVSICRLPAELVIRSPTAIISLHSLPVSFIVAPSPGSVNTSVVVSAVILSPTSITADKSVLDILTTAPLVTAPLTSSPVKTALAVG